MEVVKGGKGSEGQRYSSKSDPQKQEDDHQEHQDEEQEAREAILMSPLILHLPTSENIISTITKASNGEGTQYH